MASEETVTNITRIATEDLTIYRFVKQDATPNDCSLADAAADEAIGVCMETVLSGRAAPVAISGVIKVEAGVAITAGDLVSAGANGLAAAASAVAGEFTLGVANTDASGAGAIFEMLWDKQRVPA